MGKSGMGHPHGSQVGTSSRGDLETRSRSVANAGNPSASASLLASHLPQVLASLSYPSSCFAILTGVLSFVVPSFVVPSYHNRTHRSHSLSLPQAPRRRSFGYFYSGPADREDGVGMDHALDARDWDVSMIDKVNGGSAMDLSIDTVIQSHCDTIAAGAYDVAGVSPVCTSFSSSLRPAVRDVDHMWGRDVKDLAPRIGELTGEQYVNKHNSMITGFLRLVRALVAAGTPFWVEQPGDDGPALMPDGKPNPFMHPRGVNSAHLFRLQEWQEAVAGLGGVYICFKQCPFGAVSPKPSVIFATASLAPYLEHLARAECVCEPGEHQRLRGRDSQGRALTAISQAYAGPLNAQIAMAVDRGFPRHVRPRRVSFNLAPSPACLDCTSDSSSGEETSSESAATDSGTESESEMDTSHAASQGAPVETPGGEMRYGPAMEPRVRAAIESARLAPPRHASSRRLEAASVDELHARPYQCIPPRSRARTTSARVAGQPHHSAPDATASAAYAKRPAGAISLHQLFKSIDTYRAVIQWIADATAAMADLAAGKRVSGPPTLVVTQDELEEWARGIIWDTRDPVNCVPCPPSDETTEMPGPQINREILRAWAAELNITDEEIVAQVGYGGVESQALVCARHGADVSPQRARGGVCGG